MPNAIAPRTTAPAPRLSRKSMKGDSTHRDPTSTSVPSISIVASTDRVLSSRTRTFGAPSRFALLRRQILHEAQRLRDPGAQIGVPPAALRFDEHHRSHRPAREVHRADVPPAERRAGRVVSEAENEL